MTKIKLMKHRDDLDEFHESHIELTRAFEAQSSSPEKLCLFCAGILSKIDLLVVGSGVSLPQYQRACYEMSQSAKADPDDSAKEMMAESFWLLIQYMQATLLLTQKFSKYPELAAGVARLRGKDASSVEWPEIEE